MSTAKNAVIANQMSAKQSPGVPRSSPATGLEMEATTAVKRNNGSLQQVTYEEPMVS